MFADILAKRTKFDSAVLEKLKEKCQRETKFGRCANLSLWILFKLIKKAKKIRSSQQGLIALLFAKRSGTKILFSSTPESKAIAKFTGPEVKILLIGEDSLSQCKRYRIDAKIEMLKQLGFDVQFYSCWSDTDLAKSALPFCKIVIFYRVPLFESWRAFAADAKAFGSTLVWEIDDLVFNPQVYAQHPYLKQCSAKEREELLHGAELFSRFVDLADEIIVSTAELKKEVLLNFKKPVHIVENAIDCQLLETMSQLPQRPKEPDQILIGYGSGTLTHDADLEIAASAIAEIMSKYANVRFILLGHLKLPEALQPFGDRVQKIPFVPAPQYFQVLARLDICIAPLEKTRFNEVKSNIKFLEAAILGVPCIASPSGPFSKVIQSGTTGFLAETRDEWVKAFEQLIQGKDLRVEMAQKARVLALENYHPDVVREKQLKIALNHLQGSFEADRSLSETAPRKRRLGVVNVFFAPQSFGGATIVAEELSSRLAYDDCWEVSVFAGNTYDDLSDYELKVFDWGKVRVHSVRLPRNSTQELEFRNDVMQQLFGKYLEVVRPDVLHIHCVQHLGAGLLFEAQKRNIPVALTLHDAWWICPRQFRYIHEKTQNCPYLVQNPISCGACFGLTASRVERDQFLRKALDYVKLFLAPSRFQADLYSKNGLPEAKVKVNENGVKLPLRPRKRTAAIGPNHVVFAHLGGPSEQKGYPMIKAAFEAISGSNYTIRFTDSDLRLGIKTRLGTDLKIKGKVEIVPPFTQSEIDEFFDGIDVLIAYSQWDECFGLVVREALARDVWVITSDAGGLPEAIEQGVNGVIVPRSDQTKLISAIQYCLKNSSLLKDHVNPLKQQVRSFDQQVLELHQLLDSLVHN